MNKLTHLFIKQSPLLKTLIIVMSLTMIMSTLLEMSHVMGWREFLINQLSFSNLISITNTYFLMYLIKDRTLKNHKDNTIRKIIYNRLTKVENKLHEIEIELEKIKNNYD